MAPSQTTLFSGQLPGCPCYSGGTVPDSHRLLYECFRNLYLVRLYKMQALFPQRLRASTNSCHKNPYGRPTETSPLVTGYEPGKTMGQHHAQGKKACCKGGKPRCFLQYLVGNRLDAPILQQALLHILGSHTRRLPGWMPSSSIRSFSLSPRSADSSIPQLSWPIIFRGARLVTATKVLPTSASGS